MIDLKNEKQISDMQYGGHILSDVLWAVLQEVKPGVTGLQIDQLAEKMIKERGGESGFKKVPGYKYTLCICTNEVVVHGIPTNEPFKEGDMVCIDAGVFYKGFHTDMAETIIVGQSENPKAEHLLKVGKQALDDGIAQATIGNRVGHISQAIQKKVEGAGYGVVRSLIGHGVGRELHEEPEVPGYLQGSIVHTPLLVEGMTIAVEVIYAMGSPDVTYANKDGWSIKTADNSLSAVFERSIAITKNGPVILTK